MAEPRDLERRLEELERIVRSQRRWARIRLAVTIIILAGVAAYLVSLYQSMSGWKAEVAEPPRIGLKTPTQLVVEVPLRIYNPDGRVTARLVYYQIYVGDEYVGDGLIPYLDLPSGWSTHRVEAVIDVTGLSCGLAEELARGEKVEVKINGTALVDLRVAGLFTWKTVSVPFSVTTTFEAPPSGPARDLIELYAYACRHQEDLLRLLKRLLEGTGFLP